MEAFVLEFKELKDSVHSLQDENKHLSCTVSQITKQVADLKEENTRLRKEVDEMRTKESAQSSPRPSPGPTNSEGIAMECPCRVSKEQKIVKMECKLKKVEKRVTSMKEETSRRVDENSSKINQIHRVFNRLHVSMQSRKDLEGEVRDIKNDVAVLTANLQPQAAASNPNPTNVGTASDNKTKPNQDSQITRPARPRQHPSKAISRREAIKMIEVAEDNIKKSVFSVFLDSTPLPKTQIYVNIDEYSRTDTDCDFMDPKSGIYTVPVDGEYRFDAGTSTDSNSMYLHVIRDRDNISADLRKGGFVLWSCKAGDLVWLEARACSGFGDVLLEDIVFKGTLK